MQQRFTLEPVPGSIRRARWLVALAIDEAGVSCDNAVLLTSELASNVVHHARTPSELVIDISDKRIRVEMHDDVAVTTAFRQLVTKPPTIVDAASISGRGLGLIHTTAIDVGLIDKGDNGKAVWFEIGPD